MHSYNLVLWYLQCLCFCWLQVINGTDSPCWAKESELEGAGGGSEKPRKPTAMLDGDHERQQKNHERQQWRQQKERCWRWWCRWFWCWCCAFAYAGRDKPEMGLEDNSHFQFRQYKKQQMSSTFSLAMPARLAVFFLWPPRLQTWNHIII